MQDFVKLREAKQEQIQKIFDFSIDWNKVPVEKIRSNDFESVGSFRKLEIDWNRCAQYNR